MKKLVLSLAIISALGLSGCGSETIEDVKKAVADDIAENGQPVVASARVTFDPASGIAGMSVPNDLIFSGSQDGTLEIPVEDPTDGSDPFVAASALDGWSTAQPFIIGIDFPADRSLDSNSALNTSSVRVFEALKDGDSSDADCEGKDPTTGLICKVVGELVFSQDYITQASGNDIAFVPLKPLKGNTTYIIALTDSLVDNLGNPIAGSTTYESVRQDITTNPMVTPSQLGLQAVINSYEAAVVSAGVDSDKIIYTMAMTTQSTMDVSFTLKNLMAANLQQGVYPSIGMADSGISAADVLSETIPAEMVPLYSSANYLKGSITLPYYLGLPSAGNPLAPTNTWWKALCDSGAMLAGLAASNPDAIPDDPISETDGMCMAISQASGLAYPGLRDLGIDEERNLTRYNPVPKQTAMMPIDVQMTTPDLAWANPVRASLGLPELVKPEAGWPIVILQHGLQGTKEQMLLISGILSINGLATAAIDYPLHGSRGFDLTGNGEDDINASLNILHYVNLASLLTIRDNFRQSNSDILGLRLGLNFMGAVDTEGNPMDLEVDASTVHSFGLSLGAIMGINNIALSNTPLDPAVDGLFNIASASLAAPGLMFANFGMESPEFTGLAKSNLTYASSPEFKAFVDATYPDGHTQEQLTAAYEMFYASLTPEQQAGLNAAFAQFTLIAQTVSEAGDPINYVDAMAATQTPTHLIEIVGNGMDNLPDQVVTNTAPFTPLGGTEPAIALLGLPGVSETSQGSGAVRFVNGHHSSVLNPMPNSASPDAELSARATQEMQTQVAAFFATMGQTIVVTDTDVVLQ